MRFNILIANYKRCDLLSRTLNSLKDARRPAGFERVMVVENGPPSGAEKICRDAASELPIEYCHIAVAGKGRALQHGLGIIKDGFVLFLDDDVRVCPELLEVYAAAALEHQADKVYGGPLLVDYDDDQAPPDWLLPHLPPSAKGWQNDHKRYNLFLGANFGAFAERILAVGGFSHHLGPGAVRPGTEANPTGVESELQHRLIASGCQQMYLPEAKVWHYVPGSACTPSWALHRHYRNALSKALKQDQPLEGVCWFGVPRWLWRAFSVSSLSVLASLAVKDEEKRFKLRRDFYSYRGTIRGIRLKRKGYAVANKA